MPQLDFSVFPSQLFWLLVSFFSMLFIMSRFIIPKTAEMINLRKEKIDGDLRKAAEIKQQVEKALEKYHAALKEATDKAQSSLQKNRDELGEMINRKQEDLAAKLEAEISGGEKKIEQAKEKALQKVEASAAELAIDVLKNLGFGGVKAKDAAAAIDSLKKMTSATSKVIRNNELVLIHSSEITVGDVVVLEAGDLVPADGRIIENASLQIEEAALTGESVAVNKTDEPIENEDCPLGDRKNMAFMGSTVVYGRGKMIVTSIGMGTEMGKIASSINEVQNEETPLQKRLNQLSKILTFLVIGICIVVFVSSLIRHGEFSLNGVIDSFMVSVSLAVAAIPEGLSALVTIVLSLGVTKMSKKKAIIRKLSVVETLGCTQVICSDKTGTLTQNKMTVVDNYTFNCPLLIKAMALCSDAYINNEGAVLGESTEVALVEYA